MPPEPLARTMASVQHLYSLHSGTDPSLIKKKKKSACLRAASGPGGCGEAELDEGGKGARQRRETSRESARKHPVIGTLTVTASQAHY